MYYYYAVGITRNYYCQPVAVMTRVMSAEILFCYVG